MRFKDRIIIVTGGASGIGLAASELFAAEGAVVAINDVKVAAVQEAVQRVTAGGGRALDLAGDITDAEFAQASVQRLLAEFGRIDVLVNNAGIATAQPAEEYSAWRRMHAVNVDAPFHWSQLVAKASMIPNKRGVIINVASLAGLNAYPGDVGYIASKHGVVGLTKALAVEWAGYGIRVNCLCPGYTYTQIIRDVEAIDPTRFVERARRVPLGRAATAAEQAKAILYMASDDASYMTGVILNNDGGQMAMSSGWSPRA